MANKVKRSSIIIFVLVMLALGVGGSTAAAASWGDTGIEASWYE